MVFAPILWIRPLRKERFAMRATRYSSREMSPLSAIEVSKCLWELIWDKKIFIAFGENPYAAHYAGDTRFVVNRD